jgi:hypothetical protein
MRGYPGWSGPYAKADRTSQGEPGCVCSSSDLAATGLLRAQAFASQVTIMQLGTTSPSGKVQVVHRPAKPIGSSSARAKWSGRITLDIGSLAVAVGRLKEER